MTESTAVCMLASYRLQLGPFLVGGKEKEEKIQPWEYEVSLRFSVIIRMVSVRLLTVLSHCEVWLLMYKLN